MRPKTVPTQGVYLAVKILPTLLKAYSHIKMDSIYISVDIQVVLFWILSGNIRAKNLYTRSRIKDIHQMIKEIDSKYLIKIYFKYVSSGKNLPDLFSREVHF